MLLTDENPSNIESDQDDESNAEKFHSLGQEIPLAETTFNVWDAFDNVVLPIAWTRFTIMQTMETKVLAMMQLSSHAEPRVTVVKEMRTTRHISEVRALVLGKEWSRQVVESVEELSVFASQFFESVFCRGVPPTTQSEMVRMVKHGERNILNWWQSMYCTKRIVMKDVTICEKCNFIRRAVFTAETRYVTVLITVAMHRE